ncbi:MAG: ATP synthase F1 subunit epsilon [Verrucomicrobia bacterium]|nr:ATP synthase F1 subunit epsilon [Verrucomicrobiota bacterium]
MAKEAKHTNAITLRVRTPAGTVVDTTVESLAMPGTEGDFTVLHEHHDTVAQLRHDIGEYVVKGHKEYLSILGGVATVRGDEVEVLSPICELGRDLDQQRAETARQRAEERLADQQEGIDIARAEAALGRALLRLEVVKLLRRK